MLIFFSNASLCSLFVERGYVMPRLLHDAYHLVVADAVDSVGEGCIEVGIEGSAGCKGVALDARYLHETANRVAGHAQMVLKSHFSSIFNL